MEMISMSRRERQRLEVFSRVRRGEMTLVKASELLGLSYRQTRRFCALSRGRRPRIGASTARTSVEPPDIRSKETVSLALYERKYADYGPTLATECLKEDTARKWWSRRCGSGCCRRDCGGRSGARCAYRQRRERKSSWASWWRWTVRITTGLKDAATRRC